MNENRVKLQVQNERGHWRTTWCPTDKLMSNLTLLKGFGFKIRVGGKNEPGK